MQVAADSGNTAYPVITVPLFVTPPSLNPQTSNLKPYLKPYQHVQVTADSGNAANPVITVPVFVPPEP